MISLAVRKKGDKMCFANGICIYLLSQWNKSLYANDFFHWPDNSDFHDGLLAITADNDTALTTWM
jgi:hypothetical protein